MKRIKAAAILLLIICMMLLTGCWNYREVESLSIVAGFAIDPGEGGQKYHTTFEILDMSGNKNNQPKAELIETEGDTIFEAVRNSIKKCRNKLFFNDCRIVIINSQIAQNGISSVTDLLHRDAESRLTLNLVISQDKSAKEVLKSQGLSTPIISFEISDIINKNTTDLSKALDVKLYDTENLLNGEGVSLSLPAVKTEKEDVKEGEDGNQDGTQSNMQLSDSQSMNKQVTVPIISGTAVFKGDKLVGYLNSEETMDLLFIKNKVNGGVIVIKNSNEDDGDSLEIDKSTTTLKPVISNGEVKMQINIKCTAILGENNTSYDYGSAEGIEKLQQKANETLKSDIKNLISKVQTQYDSDIFGFGREIYRQDYSSWQELKPKWDEIFKSLQCDVKTDVEIKSTAIEKSRIRSFK